jgi:GT2 family glycosyltransferase
MSDLAILIVNWNVKDLLRACLTSVYEDAAHSAVDAEVWVVDNASQDGSSLMVRTEFPQARLVASAENLGFAGGNNLALRKLQATRPPRYALLLNPDTELRPGAIPTLIGFMDSHAQVGVAGARLFYGDGSFQHSAFGFPGLWQIACDLYPVPGRLHESRLNGRYPRRWYEGGTPFPVDHPLGAAMMVRWIVIPQVGLFDEGYHMYCEEIDWCMRIIRAGWQIYCVPEAQVIHHEGQSTRQIRTESFVNLWRSRRRLYEKHYGPVRKWLATRLVRAGMKTKARGVREGEKRGQLERAEAESRIRAYCGALVFFD